jgi:hypothetical protein
MQGCFLEAVDACINDRDVARRTEEAAKAMANSITAKFLTLPSQLTIFIMDTSRYATLLFADDATEKPGPLLPALRYKILVSVFSLDRPTLKALRQQNQQMNAQVQEVEQNFKTAKKEHMQVAIC